MKKVSVEKVKELKNIKKGASEFKKFISRGNVMDLAVGVIIGGAFTAIVNSLVKYIINPFLGLFVGAIDFSDLVFKIGNATFRVGSFLNAVINFLIIAFVVFLMVKGINKVLRQDKKEEAPAPKDPQLEVLEEIRDSLKKLDK